MIACLAASSARALDRAIARIPNLKFHGRSDGSASLRNLVAGLAIALLATGCADPYKGYAVQPLEGTRLEKLRQSLTETDDKKGIKPLVSLECFKTPTSSQAECASQRNQAISFLMAESNNLCVEHIKSIYGNEAAFNIATGSISALSAGWASISSGGQVKTLSALSAFASAERSLVNETIYKSMLTTAIGTKIEESRATKGKALLLRKKESYKDYRIEDALYDIIDYHESCSFYYGLQKALKEGTQATPEARRHQLEIQRQNLEQQMLAYRAKISPTSKGIPTTSDDLVLDSMIKRYRALDLEIEALSGFQQTNKQEAGTTSKNSTAR